MIITEPIEVTVSGIATNVTCFGASNGSIAVTNSVGSTVVITNSSNVDVTANNGSFNPDTYTLTATAPNGNDNGFCTAIASVTITEPAVLAASVASTDVTCNGAGDGTITISGATGGYGTYEYSINGGGNWQTSGIFTNVANGTYTVQIRDAAHTGCVITLDGALVITQPAVLAASVASTDVTCNGAGDGTITISGATGGYGTYEYSINGTWQTSGIFTNVANGTYTVQIRDAAHTGCVITLDGALVITQPAVLAASVASTDVTCNGASDGTITISGATGGYGTYEYSINGTWQTSGIFTNVANGTYTVQIRDAAHTGCVITLDGALVITQPAVLAASVASTDVTCNGASDGTITISGATGGYGTYEYSINGGGNWQTSGTFSTLIPSTYNVQIRDAAHTGCVITLDGALVITQPAVLAASVASTDVTCNGAGDGTITISGATGGYGTYEYSINGTWQTSGIFTNVANGTYTVQIRDAAHTGCVITLDGALVITQPAVLAASVASTDVTCNGASDGTITISGATGGYGTYEYSINGTWQTSGIFTNVANGTYTVQIRDAAHTGCVITLDGALVITQPAVLAASVASTDVTCNGAGDGTITISGATGGYGTYEYSINGTWQTSGIFTNVANGTYTVQIRDAAHTGCVITLDGALVITQPAVLAASVASTDVTCNGASDGTITISGATGGYGTYEYSINGGGNWQTSGTFSTLIPSTYNVQIRDAAHTGCVITLDGALVITQPAVLAASVASTDVTCNGASDGTITISGATGGYGTYEYSINGTWQTSGIFTNVANGTYTVQIRDAAHTGCVITLDGALVITQPAVLAASVASTDVTCNGAGDGTITISGATGGYGTYEYSINGTWQTSGIFTNVANGTYTVQIRDAAHTGCVITLDGALVITQPAVLAASVASTDVTCNGAGDGTITISGATGGYGTYEYSINGTWQTSGIFTNVANGTYTVQIRDAAHTGCVITLDGALVITQPAVLAASVASTDVTCNGAGDGTITISGATGGYGTYEYSINGGGNWQTSGIFTNVANGTYTVQIRDAAHTGCVITLDGALVITQPAVLAASVASTDVTCNGAGDGTITISGATGGYGTYEYSINGTWQTSGIFTNVANGTYTVQIRDAAHTGCVITLDGALVITQPAVLAASVASTDVTCNGAGDGTITISGATGGYGTYEYSINGTWQTSGIFTNVANGTYTVQIRDAAHTGCVITLDGTLVISQPAPVTGSAAVTSAILCNGGTATVTITGAGGTGPMSYTFNNVTNGTGIFTGIGAGTGYAWSITDANNCGPVTGTLNVTQPAAVTGSAAITTEILCNGGTATVTLTGAGGTGLLSYTFNNVTNGTGVFTGIVAGTGYAWSITDANNCGPVTGTLNVTQPAAVTGSAAVTTAILCNGGTATVTLTGAGGTGLLSYTFNNVTNGTGVFTGIAAGTGYSWSITDANNCGPVTGTLNVTQPAAVTGSAAVTTAILCNGGIATVTLTGAGGTGLLSYTFNNVTNGTGVFSGIAEGTGYAWSITDANNCGPVTGTLNVTQPAAVTGSAAVTTAILCNGGTATVTLTGAGGTPPLSYTFNGITNATGIFAGISAGNAYSWSITDANNCGPVTGTLNVTQPAAVTGSATVTTAILCNGGTATVTLTGAGGTGPLSYRFNGVTNSTGIFSGITAGNAYAWSITDANNCGPVIGALNVTQPATLVGSASVTSPVICNGGTGSITLTGAGGTAPLAYTFNGVTNSTGIFTGISAGNGYAWSITDANNCGPVAGSLNVTQPPVVTVTSASVTPSSVCGSGNVTFTAAASAGTIVWYDALTGGNVVIPPTSITATTTLYAEAVTPEGCVSAVRIAVTATASPRPAIPNTGANTYTFNGTLRTAAATVGANEVVDWYTTATGGSLTTAPSGINAGSYTAWAEARNLTTGCVSGARLQVTLIINPALITVTADAKTKVYGNVDPALTYQITSGSLIGTDTFAGALTRDAGENVGSYAIRQGTLALSANYTLSYVGANLTITTRAITITADAKTKLYGAADPALTYQITSGSLAANGDTFSGALTRVAGENAGTYPITQGSLALSSNYTITYVGANLTITSMAITVTANALTKVYGTVDPALTYTITSGSLASTDSFTGSLSRDAGESVGVYPIRQGTLALSGNYVLTFVGADLTIAVRPITVTADAKTKVYGDADPALTYQVTSGSLAGNGDTFSGALTRDAGENVGTHAITQGTLTLGSNYDITYIGADLTITYRSITVTADNSTKLYGDPDNLTYQVTSGSLVTGDTFSGALSHTGGEDAGTYPITLGTLSVNGNYTLNFIGATLTINPRPVTVTANTLSKVYGESDPMLTYSLTSGSLVLGDVFTGALIRESGENVGAYTISQGDLALNVNYILTFTGADFSITPRPITVTADARTKIYGATDPELTYQITSGNLAGNGDTFSGALVREAGENVGTYPIMQGTLSLSNNYTLTFIGADFNIVKSGIALTIAADPQTKVYGDADPMLTYTIVSGSLVGTDTFTGELTRAAGENSGTYAISQGTLAVNDNYTLVFIGADMVITPRPVTITADPKSKVFGEADPALTYEITSGELAANGDAFTGALTRAPGENVGSYAITQGDLTLGDNYIITFEDSELRITAGFELKAYPNPFSEHLWFEFDLNTDSEILIELFNVAGVKVATVFSGNLTADHYRLEYIPENIGQGVLIYRLSINGHSIVTGKAIYKK